MHEMFAMAQHGLNTILLFVVLILTLSIASRLIVRYMMKDSNRSRTTKRAIEDLAAVLVAGVLGMIMLLVVGKIMK
jgi:hypothetical protein